MVRRLTRGLVTGTVLLFVIVVLDGDVRFGAAADATAADEAGSHDHGGGGLGGLIDRFLHAGSVGSLFLLLVLFMTVANRRANRIVRERARSTEA